MRILVFGKRGQVARSLADEAGAEALTALGRDDADLARSGEGARAVAAHAPDIVVNAAAYTGVDAAETAMDAARTLNAVAAGELAGAAKAAGAHFIHLSTDYVFSGAAAEPYREDDATEPLNVYGATKLAGERAALAANPASVILRTSWIFSEYGENFVKSMLRLGADRPELQIVADQTGGPTPAREIARAVLKIAAKKHRGAPGEGIYHYQGAPAASRAALARKIFEYAGLPAIVHDIPSTDYVAPARRPLFSVLDCARIERDFGLAQPDWRVDLRRVVAALAG